LRTYDAPLRSPLTADLPVKQPIKLAVNLKTARNLGLAIPRPLMLRADAVFR
jgi:hypothetical protein